MSDPIRLRILKSLTDVLKSITPVNGYSHDMGDFVEDEVTRARVFRGRTIFGDNDPLPMMSILEDPRVEAPTQQSGTGKQIGELILLVQGFVQDDKDNPTDPAHYLSAEVLKALGNEKRRSGNLFGMGPRVMSITFGSPVHRPPDNEVSEVAYFLVSVTIRFVEDLANPFA